MPRSRGTEMQQRQSPRAVPLHLRTSSSDSDPPHHRSADRSTRLTDGQSPRGAHSDPMKQKKLGTRIADLESQLGQAQDELKSLKDQLASAEAAKKSAQEQLEKKSKKQKMVSEPVEIQEKYSTPAQEQLEKKYKKQQMVPEPVEVREKHSTPTENIASNKKEGVVAVVVSEENHQETDVFEVPVEKVTVESKTELSLPSDQDELKPKAVSLSIESATMTKPEKPSFDEVALKNDEISTLKAKLEEREKELEVFRQENEGLKIEIKEKLLELSSAQSKGEEMTFRLNQAEQELEKSKTNVLQLNEKLETTERVKLELEAEMKKLHIHTEQWRKAADAAASVLAGGVEMNGKRLSERCGSMDKHYGNVFEPVGGYAGYMGSPGLLDDTDDVFGSGKRKGSGIRMFGDLWKKKGNK
ncbi:Hypothetical predicted protein [Olea europaea subsp. europaea]|uniref:Interactor of constitutive active ROPs 4 n=1 Tax=Olea europaea subsp. europaea TaxID=158383 RepID=A0A8S0RWD7_OLEEU|nr:Hypothetical predicted protein [Olea europaea subsp. europaea]